MVAVEVSGQYETRGFGAISEGILHGILDGVWLSPMPRRAYASVPVGYRRRKLEPWCRRTRS